MALSVQLLWSYRPYRVYIIIGKSIVEFCQLTELLGAGNGGTLGVILGDRNGLVLVVNSVSSGLLHGRFLSALLALRRRSPP